jgi:hypothetical protein
MSNTANTKKPNSPKRHHYVPRFYLKGFTSPADPEVIHVFRPGQQPFSTGVWGVGFENNFYSYLDEQGALDSHTVERFLADDIERPGNIVLTKIRNYQGISGKDKEEFARYASVLLTRVPKHRARSRALFPKAIEELRTEILNEVAEARAHEPGESETLDNFVAQTTQILDEYKVQVPVKLLVNSISPKYARFLAQMTWVFLTAPTRYKFVTSDNPVVFDEGMGLLGENKSQHEAPSRLVEVTIPISTEIALWATWRNEVEGYQSATEPMVREINRRTVGAAAREIYFSGNPRWVQSLVRRYWGIRKWKAIVVRENPLAGNN